MTRVLVITGDFVGTKMAGPAIRSWNIALELSRENDVTLVTTADLETVEAPFELVRVRPGDRRTFAALLHRADVVLFQGHALSQFDALVTTTKFLVVDIYDPMHLEMLEQGRELARATWDLRVDRATSELNQQLAIGDFFICASHRQRLFYLGQLAALGRLSPATYQYDPHLERLLAVVPFGLDPTPPIHERNVLRSVVPGIGKADRVLIWGGGIYSWFDPKTLIRAVAALSLRRSDVRLYFLGTRHPGVATMGVVRESLDLAEQLGVLGVSVFFNEDWVDFTDRQNYLTEADAGVSTHMSHVETTFSFRTRILDYLWAGLPMVATEGDGFAELIEAEGLGVVVPVGDVDALESALERILYDDVFIAEATANVARVRERFYWEQTLAALTRFVRSPYHAGDWTGKRRPVVPGASRKKQHGIRHDLFMTWHTLRHEGLRETVRKSARRLGRTR